MRSSTLTVVAVLLAGCAAVAGERITQFEMAPRLEYQGFSFNRPPNSNWYMLRGEQTHTEVTLRREIDSPTHSFYAMIALARLERQPSSHEEFAELARSKGQQAPYPTRDLSREHKLVAIQNQWCIRVESLSAQLGAPPAPSQELHLIVRGFRCLHPTWPRTSLDFFYSERGLPEEIDPDLSEEGEAFLEGVRIDVAPGKPAA
jgi:hypothetical protein